MKLASAGGKNVILVDDINGADEDQKFDSNSPRLGMRFKTYEDALNYYKQYASCVGFKAIILKSSYLKSGVCRRLVLGCTRAGNARVNACYLARQTMKINCPARISLKLRNDRWLHIDSAMLDHNHPLSPCMVKLSDQTNDIRSGESTGRKGRRNFPLIDKDHGITDIGHLKFGEGDDVYIHKFFASMQNKNPNFFYLVDLDKSSRLRNVFWADARSRAAHKYFGNDVIYFDTSYVTEQYDLPLVFFTGISNHGLTVLFACGLLSDQNFEGYAWLFRSFLACMQERHPHALITEHQKPIQDAAMEVFPNTQLRFCLSRVIKSLPDYLGLPDPKLVKKALKNVIFGYLEAFEFEEEWHKVIEEYGLVENEWLCWLYANRHRWVPAYLKRIFWAGMSISQRGESTISFFDGFVYPKTSLKQFFGKYESVLENKYKKEAQADAESAHRTPLTATKFYMEEQLAKVYTLNMFRTFQDELKATVYCDVVSTKPGKECVAFEVHECSYLVDDGKATESKIYEVYFRESDYTVECVCGSFQFTGILCRHALSVFKFQGIFEIPLQYVLDRWKKDYKKLHASASFSQEMFVEGILERQNSLYSSCLQLLDFSFISDDRYLFAKKLLKDAEKSLLDEGSYRTMLSGFPRAFETQSSGTAQGALLEHFSEIDGDFQAVHGKRRGRPSKKARDDSSMEPSMQQNTQDFLRSSFIANESNLLPPTTSPHLESNVGRINLMDDIGSSDLPFGSQFGMAVNAPLRHHVASQPRMQPNNNFLQQVQGAQPMGNQPRMPWMYPQIMQEDPATRSTLRRHM